MVTKTNASQIAFTPSGNISATTVAGAIQELDSEKIIKTEITSDSGSSLIGYKNPNSGSISTNVENKLRAQITPYDFGALQNSSALVSEWCTPGAANYRGYANLAAVQVDFPHVVDGTETIAWAAIQKFFNIVNFGFSDINYVISGSFYINKKLDFNGNSLAAYSRNTILNCDCTLWDKSADGLEYIVGFSNATYINFKGVLRGYGVGSSSYVTRKTKDIFVIKAGCSYSVFDVLAPSYAKRWGVNCLNSSTQMGFNYVNAAYCGTSYAANNASLGSKYTVSNITNSGTENSAQSSALTLSTPLDSAAEAYDCHFYSPTSDIAYEVTAISADRLTVTVRPWTNPTNIGDWNLFLGGAVSTLGSDSSVHKFNYINSLSCGVGYWAKSLYGAEVSVLVTQFNNIGWITCKSMGDTSGTGFIGQMYCEGNYFNILIPNTGNYTIGSLLSPTTTRKIISYKYTSSSKYEDAIKNSLRGLQILNYGGYLINQCAGSIYQAHANNIVPHLDNTMPVLVKYRDTAMIYLKEEENLASLTGKVGYVLVATGSGVNNQPTGSWTFSPAATWTVNGISSYVLSGFAAATIIMVYADYANKNWIVKGIGIPKTASVVYDPPSLAIGARTTIQTLTVLNAGLGDKVSISFSRDLQGVSLTGYVSATDTVSFYFENRTSATVDLSPGTVYVRVD